MYINNDFCPNQSEQPYSKNMTWVKARDGINSDNHKLQHSVQNTSTHFESAKNYHDIINNMSIFEYQESHVPSKKFNKSKKNG